MSRQNEFGASWWAKHWRAQIELLYEGNRMQRGRTYARDGYVENIRLVKDNVHADVAGRRIRPYKVTIAFHKISPEQRQKLLSVLAERPRYTAMLLDGEMPREIEEICKEARFSLFPDSERELITECSCPDVENPCKHIAAVLYVLGSRMNENPFLLLEMRGVSRAFVMENLRNNWKKEEGGPAGKSQDTERESEMLPTHAYLWKAAASGAFWSAGPHFNEVEIDFYPDDPAQGALPLSWGKPDFIPLGEAVKDEIVNIMKRTSDRAREQINKVEK